MCNTIIRKTKAVTRCTAATLAHMGSVKFQPNTRRSTLLAVHHARFQEVIVIPIPAPNEKAAGATAASSAQQSAITGNPIVPLLRRAGIGFRPLFSELTQIHPFPHTTLPLTAATSS